MIMMILNTMNALAPVMSAFVTNALAAWMAVALGNTFSSCRSFCHVTRCSINSSSWKGGCLDVWPDIDYGRVCSRCLARPFI